MKYVYEQISNINIIMMQIRTPLEYYKNFTLLDAQEKLEKCHTTGKNQNPEKQLIIILKKNNEYK